MLSEMHAIVLQHIAALGRVDIRQISESYRQKAIDLGMMEPPLVNIDADQMRVTDAGQQWLRQQARATP